MPSLSRVIVFHLLAFVFLTEANKTGTSQLLIKNPLPVGAVDLSNVTPLHQHVDWTPGVSQDQLPLTYEFGTGVIGERAVLRHHSESKEDRRILPLVTNELDGTGISVHRTMTSKATATSAGYVIIPTSICPDENEYSHILKRCIRSHTSNQKPLVHNLRSLGMSCPIGYRFSPVLEKCVQSVRKRMPWGKSRSR